MTAMTAVPRLRPLTPLTLVASCALAATGCYSQQQYNQALQRSADLQAQLDQTNASLAARTEELKAERLQAAELATAKEKATRALADAANENLQLRKSLDAARRELGTAAGSLDQEHAKLQRTLDSQKEARSRMELELADRDRQIDILRSRIDRLEREIATLRTTPSRPATTQASR